MNWDGIISLLFFCIESLLLLNLLYFSRHIKEIRKGIFLIGLLSLYQLTEYLICGIGLKYSGMTFLAFCIISYLPPLNLMFVLELLKKRFRHDWMIFIPVTVLLIYYAGMIQYFDVVKCTVIYVIYSYPLGDLYGVLYYLPILIVMLLLIFNAKSKGSLQKKNIYILLTGNIIISLPVITAFTLYFTGNPELLDMIISVMCKFALIIAICYTLVILNLSMEKQN